MLANKPPAMHAGYDLLLDQGRHWVILLLLIFLLLEGP
jgi:hypothetical protein